jgi:hypothetical protein
MSRKDFYNAPTSLFDCADRSVGAHPSCRCASPLPGVDFVEPPQDCLTHRANAELHPPIPQTSARGAMTDLGNSGKSRVERTAPNTWKPREDSLEEVAGSAAEVAGSLAQAAAGSPAEVAGSLAQVAAGSPAEVAGSLAQVAAGSPAREAPQLPSAPVRHVSRERRTSPIP